MILFYAYVILLNWIFMFIYIFNFNLKFGYNLESSGGRYVVNYSYMNTDLLI